MTTILGDCLVALKSMADSSVDSIVTDPPYEIGFMSKGWDNTGIANKVELWQECLRVLKPGGHLLAFGGTRTYHRMTCAIEDAGFEIRDMIEWLYGSGFPKSNNIRLNINKGIDNLVNKLYNTDIWKTQSKTAKYAENLLLKNIIEIGTNIEIKDFVVDNAIKFIKVKRLNVPAKNVKRFLKDTNLILEASINIVVENVDTKLKQLPNNAKSVIKPLQDQNPYATNIFIVRLDVKGWLKEKMVDKIKGAEVQKTLLGKWLSLNEMDLSANYAVLIKDLKDTILNLLKISRCSDTISQMELPTVINVIITKSTMECLILSMVDILKEINLNLHGGIGSALKPAHEPVVMARKPLAESTIAKNVLKYGTGAINIDKCRIGDGGDYTVHNAGSSGSSVLSWNKKDKKESEKRYIITTGRFPANLIVDDSKCVRDMFPNSNDRFFKCCVDDSFLSSFANKNSIIEEKDNICKNTSVNSALKNTKIIQVTDQSSVLKNVTQKVKKNNNQNNYVNSVKENSYLIQMAGDSVLNLVVIADLQGDSQLRNIILHFTNAIKKALKKNCVENIEQMIFLGQKCLQDLKQMITVELKNNHVKYVEVSKLINTMMTIQNLLNIDGFVESIISDITLYNTVLGAKDYLSRFKYCAKSSKAERNLGCEDLEEKKYLKDGGNYGCKTGSVQKLIKEGRTQEEANNIIQQKATSKNNHPCLKPQALLRYLITLVTPPKGIVLDPFMGSGSTGVAAYNLDFEFIGIEKEEEYYIIANKRIAYAVKKESEEVEDRFAWLL